jgi:DNA polymerase V
MGDVARCSLSNEDKLFKLLGINAELLIDHAWGYEPCTIESIKSYKPSTTSLCSGQVLHCPYDYEKTKLIVKEMTDILVLDLVDKNVVTNISTICKACFFISVIAKALSMWYNMTIRRH